MSPRVRIVLLATLVAATVTAVVVLAASGDDPGPEDAAPTSTTATSAEEVASTTAAPASTAPEPTATPATTARPEPAVGEHPICAAWDTFLAEGVGLTLDTPDEVRLDNERQRAFYSVAVDLLDGAGREAAAGLLAYHEERADFWPAWGWDFDAYLLESFSDPELPTVPWPTSESANGWRQTLTDRCGLEFLIEESS